MDIDTLNRRVSSIDRDFTMAVSFHETWKPMAVEVELHERMGSSYATQAFLVIRTALRREMLLALMRIWDTQTKTSSLAEVFLGLNQPETWRELLSQRTSLHPHGGDLIAEHLTGQKQEVSKLYQRYEKDGEKHASLRNFLQLRHGTLAHSQAPSRKVASAVPVDDDVNAFYEDTGQIVNRLMSLVCGVAINYDDTKGVYAHYSKLFWESARGEKTAGHPRFREPS